MVCQQPSFCKSFRGFSPAGGAVQTFQQPDILSVGNPVIRKTIEIAMMVLMMVHSI